MFAVVRSVFWLTVAYMVIKPGVDLPNANEISQQAMAAGSQIIAEQIANIECDSIQCLGGKAIATQTLDSFATQTPPPVAVVPLQEIPAAISVAPVPMPRLHRES
ncbi:MAG: hypothetical protein P0Y65_11400 [Candidatus Devosia phytovorans]|uniref:Uncharacterized protein n=1 Tax=Candidatus Devosia phytovorans TaxID=3121372 RepID=A0AAJ5VRI4_9HYPH|nr:hypothetical protein [Devosia sp.]WEK02815.1 MAG: hypothetical protein P0Y65_11400 [Devosia sp.]